MKTNTLLLQKTISKVLPNSKAQTITEVLFLFLLGMFAITLHSKLRIPMHLPGKHGLLFMFIIISGRLTSRFQYPTMISTFGASTLILTNMLGFGDPFLAGIYLIIGFSVDFFLNNSKSVHTKLWFIAFISGLSYMVIPLSRIIISFVTGFTYKSLTFGLFYPLFTHFCFGLAGGLLAVIAINFATKRK